MTVKEYLHQLTEEELCALRQAIQSGELHTHVTERLLALQNPQHVCPVCNAPINPDKDITLHFGKPLRFRATFDGYDCLAHFVKTEGRTRKQNV